MTDPKELIAEARVFCNVNPHRAEHYLVKRLADALEAAVKDSERLDYILPLLELADGDGDAIATRIGGALLLGLTGRAAIDAARFAK